MFETRAERVRMTSWTSCKQTTKVEQSSRDAACLQQVASGNILGRESCCFSLDNAKAFPAIKQRKLIVCLQVRRPTHLPDVTPLNYSRNMSNQSGLCAWAYTAGGFVTFDHLESDVHEASPLVTHYQGELASHDPDRESRGVRRLKKEELDQPREPGEFKAVSKESSGKVGKVGGCV